MILMLAQWELRMEEDLQVVWWVFCWAGLRYRMEGVLGAQCFHWEEVVRPYQGQCQQWCHMYCWWCQGLFQHSEWPLPSCQLPTEWSLIVHSDVAVVSFVPGPSKQLHIAQQLSIVGCVWCPLLCKWTIGVLTVCNVSQCWFIPFCLDCMAWCHQAQVAPWGHQSLSVGIQSLWQEAFAALLYHLLALLLFKAIEGNPANQYLSLRLVHATPQLFWTPCISSGWLSNQ